MRNIYYLGTIFLGIQINLQENNNRTQIRRFFILKLNYNNQNNANSLKRNQEIINKNIYSSSEADDLFIFGICFIKLQFTYFNVGGDNNVIKKVKFGKT